jgi:chemotaxis protein histidine kinase CheA
MSRRTISLVTFGMVCAIGLMMLQPAAPRHAQAQSGSTPPATLDPYLGALGAQATANAQATYTANQSQQSAAQAAQNAAALQAQAAAAQAQAAAAQAQAMAQAQQATAVAEQQRAQMAALQATADAAALQATAIVQQTKTALEVKATQTALAIDADKQRVAVAATRSAVEAQDRDNRAVATSVAISLQATQQSVRVKAQLEAAQSASDQRTHEIGNAVLATLVIIAGVFGLILLFKGFRRVTGQLGPVMRMPTSPVASPPASSAALMVIDAATGDVAARIGDIHVGEDAAEAQLLRQIFECAKHA